jgi:hypothetical protein
MTVENPRGWTAPMEHIENLLMRGGVDRAHVSERARMFIEQWSRPSSPLEAYGRPATLRRRSQLTQLGLHLPFIRPHLEVALRGLRRVAGELRHGGRIDAGEAAALLHFFAPFPVEIDMVAPLPRPAWLVFPQLRKTGWREDDNHRAWLEGVEEDVAPFPHVAGGEVVLGEMTTLTIHRPSRSDLMMERFRVPFLERRDHVTPTTRAYELPRATVRGGLRAIGCDVSPYLMRRMDRGLEAPAHELIVCPILAERLRWRLDPNDRSRMLDAVGAVVARMYWWRDGGPSDYYRENQWAEGTVVVLTQEGREQLERMLGATLMVRAFAQRSVRLLTPSDGQPMVRAAFL